MMKNKLDKYRVARKSLAVAVLLCCAAVPGLQGRAHAQASAPVRSTSPPTKEDQMVAPALEHYTQDPLLGDVWKRPGLAPRDRSIVTVAVLAKP
ncbi:hypothetical protein [Pseudoduganella lurida]|nr:hypothetical protein [Pseudoduganella lurida]